MAEQPDLRWGWRERSAGNHEMAERAVIPRGYHSQLVGRGLGVLSGWINGFLARASPVPRAAFARQHEAVLHLAENLGVLRRTGTASELACTACTNDPHRCRVV